MAEKISLRFREPESDDNNSCGVLESIKFEKRGLINLTEDI